MMKRMLMLLMLLGLLLFAGRVLAMSSTHYQLDWFAPLTSSGGATGSTHYAGDFSVGQSVVGHASSTGYTAGLGYWYGSAGGYQIYLPIVLR